MNIMDKNLLKNIKYNTNLIFENVDKIIKSEKPVGIYGNGIYASYIAKCLKKWSINIDFFVVDDEYYSEKNGSNVIKFNDLGRYKESILIIGFETLIGKEACLRAKIAKVLHCAPGVEILDFEHCYLDYGFITYKYILDNYDAFQTTFNALCDNLSKRVMVEFLNTCISGRSELLGLLNQDCTHDYDYDILYDSEMEGIIVECGAYNGKTAMELDEYLTRKKIHSNIFALEPDPKNYKILCDKVNCIPRIKAFEFGTASKDDVLFFDQQGGSGSTFVNEMNADKEHCVKIPVRSIDSIMEEFGPIHSVLMDIEGSELDTLKGSVKTIMKYKPKFATRIYHKKEDLITIPQFFINLKTENKYNLYLRNSQNTRGPLDVTLYAI